MTPADFIFSKPNSKKNPKYSTSFRLSKTARFIYYTNLETAYADAYFDAWVQYHDIAPEKLNFNYVEKAREIYTLFLGKDCYDDVADLMYGGFQKLDISKI